MLEQNTDRTWWMIGALVVGLAIIVAVKTAFPTFVETVMNTVKAKMTEIMNGGSKAVAFVDVFKLFLPLP